MKPDMNLESTKRVCETSLEKILPITKDIALYKTPVIIEINFQQQNANITYAAKIVSMQVDSGMFRLWAGQTLHRIPARKTQNQCCFVMWRRFLQ